MHRFNVGDKVELDENTATDWSRTMLGIEKVYTVSSLEFSTDDLPMIALKENGKPNFYESSFKRSEQNEFKIKINL